MSLKKNSAVTLDGVATTTAGVAGVAAGFACSENGTTVATVAGVAGTAGGGKVSGGGGRGRVGGGRVGGAFGAFAAFAAVAAFLFAFFAPFAAPAVLAAAVENVTTTADNGAGSMRQAIANVASGGTVDCSAVAGQTITLASQLVIEKNVTINGASVVITGNAGDACLLRTQDSAVVTFRRIHFHGSSVFFVGNWGKHANKGYLCKKTPA